MAPIESCQSPRTKSLDLTYTLTRNNCNSVITTLLLQAGIDLPHAPARFMPGYGRSIL